MPDDPELRRLLEQVQARLLATSAPTITILAIFTLYEAARRHEGNWPQVRYLLAPFVARCGGMLGPDVTPIAWAEHRSHLAVTLSIRGKPFAAATRNLMLLEARAMLRWAARAKLIPVNPLADAELEDTISARETWLTVDQFDRLFAAVDVLRYPLQRVILRWFLLATTGSGYRIAEAIGIRRDRIGADGVVVLATKMTKSRRQRITALTARALAAVDDIPPVAGCPYVAANPATRKPYSDTQVRRWFREAAVASGLDAEVADGDVRLRPHDMRHTFASQADEAGAHATDIRDALGHASLATTERYLHRRRAARAVAMATLMDRKPPKGAEKVPYTAESHSNESYKGK